MTGIFTKTKVVRIDPTYTCESICAFKDKVFIGTKQGLITYTISDKSSDKSGEVKAEFNFVIRDFNRKSIVQIECIEEFGILLSLSNGTIFVHRLNDYKLISVSDVKSITKFCFDVFAKPSKEFESEIAKKKRSDTKNEKQLNEETLSMMLMKVDEVKSNCELRICGINKQKLILMNWDRSSNSFKMSDKVFRLPDYPLVVQFLSNYLCVATKYEYLLMNIDTGAKKSLYNVGKCQDPFIFRVSDILGLKIDDIVTFIDKEGNTLSSGNLRWSFVPAIITYHPPFAISLVDKFVEIRMITPAMLIQSLAMDNASLICRYLDRLYVIADKSLYLLSSKSRNSLVKSYVDSEDFELALILAKTSPLVGEPPIDCVKINIHYALSLYLNQHFEKSFNIFYEMKIDPSHVLSLFPSLCPDKFKNIVHLTKFINSSNDFNEEEKKAATRAFIDYLVKWRVKLRKQEDSISCTSIADGKTIEKSKAILQPIIDTSLLKCYLTVNSSLVAPLLRQENFCHLEETEKTLEKQEKYQELILLYESHEKHDNALHLLHSQSVKSHSALFGNQPTLNYMKNLNSQHLHLIYEYGDRILKSSPMDWLGIFSDWYQKEKSLTSYDKPTIYPAYKDNVLKHLQSKCPEMVIPFLERIIFENNNNDDSDVESSEQESLNSKDLSTDESSTLSSLSNSRKINFMKFELLSLDDSNGLPINEEILSANIENLHTSYAIALKDQILKLRPTMCLDIHIKNERDRKSPDSKDVYELRSRLKKFLESEKSKYDPRKVLDSLPYDAFYEERTVLLAKIGQHKQALTLWIYLLDDWEHAEEHCMKVYKTNKEIFCILLNVCIEPSDPTSIGIIFKSMNDNILDNDQSSICNKQFPKKLNKAVEIMKKYGDKLNPSLAIKLLSSEFNIKDLLPFAQNSLRRQASQLNQCVFQRNLQFFNKLSSNFKLFCSAQKCFTVTENSKCFVCKKPMGISAFARYPNESLVHYGCCKSLPKIKI